MEEVVYKMTQEMYDSIRFSKYKKNQTKPLTREEILDYVNTSFGLLNKVNEITIG